MNQFQQVDQLKNQLSSLRPLNKAELKRLRDEFIIETTYNSNAIEGNTLTLRETALILQEGITIGEKPIREHLEVIGFKDAFHYIIELASKDEPLSERIIKNIHSLVLMNDRANRGQYRGVPVQILGANHTPPQPFEIEPRLQQLLADYEVWKNEKHVIEAIAHFHLEFEAIHPFIDGNGRTGRLLINLELIKHGYLPVDIKFTDRRKYYDSFDIYHSDKHNIQGLTDLITQYELEELKRYIAMIQSK